MIKWLLVGLVGVLGFGHSAHASVVSISDGDFESLPDGLATPGTPLVVGAWTFENHAGVISSVPPGKVVRLESGGSAGSDPTMRQTVTGLTIGQKYEVTWDYGLRVNFAGTFGNGPSFGVFLDSQTLGSAVFLGGTLSTSFIQESAEFTATATSHTLWFAGELDGRTNGAGTTDVSYNIDNVSLTAVPEPGGWAVWITVVVVGLGVTLSRKWKQCRAVA